MSQDRRAKTGRQRSGSQGATPRRQRSGGPSGQEAPRRPGERQPAGRGPSRLIMAGIVALLVVVGGIAAVVAARQGLLGSQPVAAQRGILFSDSQRIWLVDPAQPAGSNGGQRELLNVAGKGSVGDPAWSPNGTEIAYAFTPVPARGATYGSDIYVMRADGSQPRAAFTHDADGGLARAPVWSPDGGSLYFSYSFPRPGAAPGTVAFVQQVERLELKTGTRTVVAPGGDLPTLAPDGTRLVYLHPATEPERGSSLWIAGADGSNARPLIPEGQFTALGAARFAPDGASLLVLASGGDRSRPRLNVRPARPSGHGWPPPVAAHGYPMDLWLVDVASGRLELLAALAADDLAAAWSPDGGRLALSSSAGLYILDLTTADLSPRSTTPGFGSLDWSGGS